MRTRMLLMMSSILAVPAIASAQVVIEPPGAYVAPPAPVYAAPPPPPVYAPPVYAPPPPRYYAPPPIYVQPAPHIIIRTKVRWWRRAGVYVQPAPVVIAPPAVYVQPAPQPVYVEQAPPPVYYAPPAPPAAPAPVLALARPYAPPPPWSARFGLGVRGTGQVVNDQWNNMGIGGELLYRVSAHVSTELACEYQKNVNGPVDRIDIPTTLGVRLHIGRPSWVVSPYFVAAAGLDVAWQDLRFATDTAYYFDGQVGGGLELRLGQHVAITADARFDGKKRVNDPEPAVALTTSLNGKPVAPLGDQYGGQFRLGFAVYF